MEEQLNDLILIWFFISYWEPIVVSPLKSNALSHTHLLPSIVLLQGKTLPVQTQSAFSQCVRMLLWRVLGLKSVQAVPPLVAPAGGARSRWTRLSKRSQIFLPHFYFYTTYVSNANSIVSGHFFFFSKMQQEVGKGLSLSGGCSSTATISDKASWWRHSFLIF